MLTFKQFLYENESTELAKDYINYYRDEPQLSGTEFIIRGVEGELEVVIYQETETIADTPEEVENQDAEPDKYRVFQRDVPIGIWKQFMKIVVDKADF